MCHDLVLGAELGCGRMAEKGEIQVRRRSCGWSGNEREGVRGEEEREGGRGRRENL